MKRTVLFCLFSLSALSLSACGGSNSKLTDAQKEELRNFTRTTAKFKGVASSAQGHRHSHISGSHENDFEDFSTDNNMIELSKLIGKAIESGRCGDPKQAYVLLTASSNANIKYSGQNCPFTASVNNKADQSQKKVSVSLDFKLIDEELIKLSEITELHLTMNMSGSDQNSASADLSADLHHKTKGKVGFAMNLSEDGEEVKMTFKFTFPDYVAEFKIKADQDGHKIKLNGEEITDEQFHDYMSGLEKKYSL